ncbi:MAG: Xaa-Pro peptidase family protein [Candidatus Bathyarchaeia archaeon]|jgi:Xaa-Pro dipeptidase
MIKEMAFPISEFKERLEKVRGYMKEAGMDTLLVNTPENIYYLIGHDTPGYYAYQCLIVTRDRDPVMVLRFTEGSSSKAQSWIDTFALVRDADDPLEKTVSILKDIKCDRGRIGIETHSWFLTVAHYERLKKLLPEAKFMDSGGIVERCRMIKSDREIAYIRKAADIVSEGMKVAIDTIEEGKTENDVAAEFHKCVVGLGSEWPGLPPFIKSGPRVALTHVTWRGRTLRKGDHIIMELPAAVRRYHAALERTVSIGEPSEAVKRMEKIVIASLEAVFENLRPGAKVNDVCQACYEAQRKAGMPEADIDPKSRRGYSIGIAYPPDWGEGHIISIGPRIMGVGPEPETFKQNMTFHSPHPGGAGIVNVPPELRVAISETILVTKDGCEPLTHGVERKLFVK